MSGTLARQVKAPIGGNRSGRLLATRDGNAADVACIRNLGRDCKLLWQLPTSGIPIGVSAELHPWRFHGGSGKQEGLGDISPIP